MPPKRKSQPATPASGRATRSRTARNPSQEFIELPPNTRKRSTSSAASTTSGERDRIRPTDQRIEKKASGRSLRRHFTIELPAQQVREAARSSEEETSPPPEDPKTPIANGSVSNGPAAATADATPSPSRASPWGFASSIFNMARRVLSPFPPSKKLQITSSQPPITPSTELPSGLSPITEESPSKIQETPTAARVSRKRKTSVSEEFTSKRTRVTEETLSQQEITGPPAGPSHTPGKQPIKTPSRRTAKKVREQRNTPAKSDPALFIPYIPNISTFAVPEDPDSPEEDLLFPSLPLDKPSVLQDMEITPKSNTIASPPAPTTATKATQTGRSLEALIRQSAGSSKGAGKSQQGEEAKEPETSKKRKRVKVDDLSCIPSRRPGQSAGTFALLDEFFDYDQDTVEIDENQLEEFTNRPAKKARLERNVFDMVAPITAEPKTPASPSTKAKPSAPSTTKDTLVPRQRQSSPEKSRNADNSSTKPVSMKPSSQNSADLMNADSTANETLNGVSQQPDALSRKRSEAEKYKPTKGSRLREMSRLSSTSTLPGSPPHFTTGEPANVDETLGLPNFTTSANPPRGSAQNIFSSIAQSRGAPVQSAATEGEEACQWSFPSGERWTEIFTEEDYAWARAHPPSEQEVNEALVNLRADYAAFVANGGPDLSMEQLMAAC
ncbi:hypothetical protein K461DRAFT_281696 [Myriangium duriaei CBS 260.36]|uniref:Uncharacterized protein n=1 Tax=Myriangium duriaei CBS 260.36 TaxID=1168546 RepID=A0A9P4IVN3_9PEZI|nr:hypothetical protein K461DRAFT_281696 [Myriangium duriaei CBS 260.36]